MIRPVILLVLLTIQITGCNLARNLDKPYQKVGGPPIVPEKSLAIYGGNHPNCSDVKFASTDYEHYRNFREQRYFDIAVESFQYAWMSSNTYEDYEGKKPKFHFCSPERTNCTWEQIERKRKWSGLGYHIYRSAVNNTIAIAFEGTKRDSINDSIFGNFTLLGYGQYAQARRLVKKQIAENPNMRIVTTGHSLGGALAIHAAIHHDNVTAYTFNTSPLVHPPLIKQLSNSRIVVISEDRDILSQFRSRFFKISIKINPDDSYTEFDFVHSDNITEHSIYYLTRGLTMVAALADKESRQIANTLLYDDDGNTRPPGLCLVK